MLEASVRSIIATLVVAALPHVAAAQNPAKVVGEFAGGALLFADDAVVEETFVGGAVRYYVRDRVSLGSEFAFINGARHSHLMLTGNVTFDFLVANFGQPAPFTPFVVVGAGLFRTRESFPGGVTYASSEGAFTAGGGVRATFYRRLLVGAEARVGWELHLRLNALAGVRF